jgi:hypothetical protein
MDISDENVASIFSPEERAKQETSMKLCCCLLHGGFMLVFLFILTQ